LDTNLPSKSEPVKDDHIQRAAIIYSSESVQVNSSTARCQLNSHVTRRRGFDYSFFHDGAVCFGKPEYHTSWAKRELFRHFDEETKSYGPHFKPSELQAMYRIIAGQTKRYIECITKDIEAANTIMGMSGANERMPESSVGKHPSLRLSHKLRLLSHLRNWHRRQTPEPFHLQFYRNEK
jgi:hypothetical protein